MKKYSSLGTLILILACAVQAQQVDKETRQSVEVTPIDDLQDVSSYGCDASIDLNFGIIPANTYQASQTILASGVVESGKVILRAGESVTLDDGFEVEVGAELEVQIGDCLVP